jgi:iron complex outermembrane receptor protein
LSLYGNYIEGLSVGPTAPQTAANAFEVFPPIKSKQYEVDAKLDFGQFATTLAAFQITQPNSFTDPATNIFGVDGEQRNRGLEFNVFGEPQDGFRLLGGLAFTKAS